MEKPRGKMENKEGMMITFVRTFLEGIKKMV